MKVWTLVVTAIRVSIARHHTFIAIKSAIPHTWIYRIEVQLPLSQLSCKCLADTMHLVVMSKCLFSTSFVVSSRPKLRVGHSAAVCILISSTATSPVHIIQRHCFRAWNFVISPFNRMPQVFKNASVGWASIVCEFNLYATSSVLFYILVGRRCQSVFEFSSIGYIIIGDFGHIRPLVKSLVAHIGVIIISQRCRERFDVFGLGGDWQGFWTWYSWRQVYGK